jgi:hypothetical protein
LARAAWARLHDLDAAARAATAGVICALTTTTGMRVVDQAWRISASSALKAG